VKTLDMLLSSISKFNRKVSYNGLDYTVAYTLQNGLLLAVPTKSLEEKKFPIEPIIIPDESFFEDDLF